MKQRLLGALVAGSLLVGLVAVPSLAAQGGTERYQVGTTTYTIAVLDTYLHTFVVTANPCDGSIAIAGSTPIDSDYYTTETVVGTLADGQISFTSTYDGPYDPGYSWSGSFPVAGGALAGDFTGTVTAEPTTFTEFKNHGEYVASMGGGADAAHSCVGMPVVSGRADAAGEDPADPTAFEAKMAAIESRLLATLQGVVARLQANPHAAAHAVPAVQKHIDKLAAGPTGPDRAAAGGSKTAKETKQGKPAKPTLPAAAQEHSNKDKHPSKP